MSLIRELEKLSPGQREKFEDFSKLLICVNKTHNLTRISDPQQVRVRHFEDSLACLAVIKGMKVTQKDLIDIGSGGGLPGIALAIALPDWKVTCVEATGKKAAFLNQVKEELGLGNLTVVNERAEVLARRFEFRENFAIATARAVANLAVLAELSLGFVRPGGSLIAWKGVGAQKELAGAKKALHKMGSETQKVISYQTGQGLDSLNLVVARKQHPTQIKYPRAFQMIKKAPL